MGKELKNKEKVLAVRPEAKLYNMACYYAIYENEQAWRNDTPLGVSKDAPISEQQAWANAANNLKTPTDGKE